MRSIIRQVVFSVSLLWALVACYDFPTEPPAAGPHITGQITRVETEGGVLAEWGVLPEWLPLPARVGALNILVEERPGWPEHGDGAKLWAWISGGVHIFREEPDGSVARAHRTALKVGALVSVWITGNILDSYPQKATTTDILVRASQ